MYCSGPMSMNMRATSYSPTSANNYDGAQSKSIERRFSLVVFGAKDLQTVPAWFTKGERL